MVDNPEYNNMDKLYEAVAEKGPVCVGLDTAVDYVPPRERRQAASDAEAVLAFNKAIVDAALDLAACFKVQIAYYESMGLAGLTVYAETLRYIRGQGGLVIADIKRGDIADTAARYAKAHFEGDFEADFVTLSPYMGMDSFEPWLSYADIKGKGAFVLMRTSNKGMRDFQYLPLAAGQKSHRLYDAVGSNLSKLAKIRSGKYGYGAFGAVIGCTEWEEAALIRDRYPTLFFLIPGYGAQGGAADDAAVLLQNGNGGVVNAARSILKAWTADLPKCGESLVADGALEKVDNAFAAAVARRAAMDMRNAIRAAVLSRSQKGKRV
jgi:orotidine-5'-phosphate decarboxylase